MKKQLFRSTAALAACVTLWALVQPLVATTTPVNFVGFNLSLPALLTGASIIGGFIALFIAMKAIDAIVGANRESRQLDHHLASGRLAARR